MASLPSAFEYYSKAFRLAGVALLARPPAHPSAKHLLWYFQKWPAFPVLFNANRKHFVWLGLARPFRDFGFCFL